MFVLNKTNSIANHYLAELRDVDAQKDSMRFRRNMERLGEVFAYEISKKLNFEEFEIQTPLGLANINLLAQMPVLATILRAGLPLHQGMLNVFDQSNSAFISAYRKNKKSGNFVIQVEYVATPDLEGKTVIICDPMLATGQSMVLCCKELLANHKIKALHIVCVIASQVGIEHVKANLPNAHLWIGAIDEELTTKAYIVPGLGDAGDLAFGEKI